MDRPRHIFGLDKDTESVILSYVFVYRPLLRFVSKTWLRACKGPFTRNVWAEAARHGYLAVLRWANENRFLMDAGVTMAAAENGHLEVLKWAKAAGIPFANWTRKAAVRAGYLDVIEWSFSNFAWWVKNIKYDVWWHEAANEAAQVGHVDTLEWLTRTSSFSLSNILKWATRGGQLHVFEWVKGRMSPQEWDDLRERELSLCTVAADSGNLKALIWFRANGFPWRHDICELTAAGGSIECMEWVLRNGGGPLTKFTCYKAIARGHLALLMWLISNGCPWSKRSRRLASKSEFLDIRAWAQCNWPPSSP